MSRPDVVILGAGLAGLTLARQLLLETDRRVLVLDRSATVPAARQKVGESTVQLAGDYLGRVLDLEHLLVHDHHLKYNLRFHWRVPGRDGRRIEDYSQAYIRAFSNVPSYQVDRNRLEQSLLELCASDPRFELVPGVRGLEVELASGGRHRVAFTAAGREFALAPQWVVDASGRDRVLARKYELGLPSPIDNGATFWWVDGTLDIDRLGGASPRERRARPARRELGHLPAWLATNHLAGPGFWFWLIPLHRRTSLGLVYDPRLVKREQVRTAKRATAWISERFPMIADELAARPIQEWAGFRRYSHDCARAISADRWALTGEAGRFSDPLYSPGSDLIALHNSAIVRAIRSRDQRELETRVGFSEPLLRALFKAYEPSYQISYDALGDQEAFVLKYTWELTIYFAFYVFPFLNDLFDERRFVVSFLRSFARLGPLNREIQQAISDFVRWKWREGLVADGPHHVDFTEIGWLKHAEKTFYRVGVSVAEAREVIAEQLASCEEMAEWIKAWIAARRSGRALHPGPVGGRGWTHDCGVLRRLAVGERVAALAG